jgi:hypothetical protein
MTTIMTRTQNPNYAGGLIFSTTKRSNLNIPTFKEATFVILLNRGSLTESIQVVHHECSALL